MNAELKSVPTEVLDIGYFESGPADGPAVVLLHGFPYDAHAYDDVAAELSGDGFRVIVPFMRGYGPTRFQDPERMRSGEQAAFGDDLRQLIDALGLESPLLGAYDWGGRAAHIVAALWPERVSGLVHVTGYNIFGPPASTPADPETEHRLWYQHYMSLDRGRQMLETRRHEFLRYLWQDWSPRWKFDDATFDQTAASFDNPDFVEVVLHSYRHRNGLAASDPALAGLAEQVAAQPTIPVPTFILHGTEDMHPVHRSADRSKYTGRYERRVIEGPGHNLPQEDPRSFAKAVREVYQWNAH
jgi:pimeloyl-ACP methyl ester carboxylesterase